MLTSLSKNKNSIEYIVASKEIKRKTQDNKNNIAYCASS